jgi:transcriptional regulator with XRE-family HTH domain
VSEKELMNKYLNNRSPKDIDVYAGEQLKLKRTELGMTQKTLASLVGVTFQQIQKYEKGLNRIGASRLYEFCQILGVKPSFFFQNIDYTSLDVTGSGGLGVAESSEKTGNDEIMELISLYNAVKNPANRKLVIDLLRSFIVSGS